MFEDTGLYSQMRIHSCIPEKFAGYTGRPTTCRTRLCTPSREPVTLSTNHSPNTGVFRHHPLTRSHRVLRLRSGERMNTVSGAGMGGNGPQHTLVMRGASPAKRPSRESLEAHHSQARRSLRTSIAPANFFSTAAAVEERLNAVTDTSRRDVRFVCDYLPTVE